MWKYKVSFQENLQKSWFLHRFISEILSKKKLNRRVVQCDGEVENLILKSIQTLSRLYSLLPSYPIREDFPEILIVKIPMMSNNINCISQIVHSFRNIIQKVNLDIIIDIMAKKKIDAYCIQETWLDEDFIK